MPYPDGEALSDFLISAGVIDSEPADLTDYDAIMSAASATFEQDTGWIPFLEEGATKSSKFFNPPGSDFMVLPDGILSIEYLKINTVAKTENTDFWLEPYNATPKRMVQFNYCVGGQPRTIEIKALWGYTATLPERVNQALLSKGAMEAAPKTWGAGGEVVRIKQGPVELEKAGASASGGSLMDIWKEFYVCTVNQFKQVRSVTA